MDALAATRGLLRQRFVCPKSDQGVTTRVARTKGDDVFELKASWPLGEVVGVVLDDAAVELSLSASGSTFTTTGALGCGAGSDNGLTAVAAANDDEVEFEAEVA